MKFHIAVTVLSLLSSVSGDVNNKDTSDVSSSLSSYNTKAEANVFIWKLKQPDGQSQQRNHHRQKNHLQQQQLKSRHNQHQLDTDIDLDSLKNCDPDVGILTCSEKEYCINKTHLGMEGSGGLCIPFIDEDLDHAVNQNQRKLEGDFKSTCGTCTIYDCGINIYSFDADGEPCYCSCADDCTDNCCSGFDYDDTCYISFNPNCGACDVVGCGSYVLDLSTSDRCLCSCLNLCDLSENCCSDFESTCRSEPKKAKSSKAPKTPKKIKAPKTQPFEMNP